MAFRAEHELHKRRLGRNVGLGAVLIAFVALVFGLTVVKVTRIGETDGFEKAVQSEPASQPTPKTEGTKP